jgi:hypothetical protein
MLMVSFETESGTSRSFMTSPYQSWIHFGKIVTGETPGMELSEDLSFSAASGTPILGTCRVHHTRRPFRAPILSDPTSQLPERFLLCYGDIDGSTKWAKAGDVGEDVDHEMEYGIDGSDRCLRTQLTWSGRHGTHDQFSFYPDKDFVLFNMVSPIVHGSRALFLWALDCTLQSGNGGTESSNPFRLPMLMLDWGPSLDNTNVDMLERGFSALDSLTGQISGRPDFLSALVSDDWDAMGWDDAQNALYYSDEFHADPGNNYLNFLAVQEESSDDILLIVVNDSDTEIGEDYIVFPNLEDDLYSRQWVAGYECPGTLPEGETELALYFDGMGPFQASLYRLISNW